MQPTSVTVQDISHDRCARQEFARRLAGLHRAAGTPSLRKVAALARQRGAAGSTGRAVPASAQRISDWMTGRNVPAKYESLYPVLQVLTARAHRGTGTAGSATPPRGWRSLWEAARTAAPDRTVDPTTRPYPDLGVYTYEHGDIFFGRQRALATVLAGVHASARRGTGDVIVLTGASGVGKSALLRAGVVPTLAAEAGRWTVATLVIGPGVVRSLDRIHRDIAVPDPSDDSPDRRRPLIVIDQFEKLFAPDVGTAARESFLVSVQRLCSKGTVIVSVRSDHLAACAPYPWLAHALRTNRHTLAPMTRRELTAVIAGPPRTRGVTVDPGAVDLLLTEAHPPRYSVDRQHAEAGLLPLLHATLGSMWAQRTGERLDVTDYRRAGGLERTVGALAEHAWAGLTLGEQTQARQILLTLVSVHRDGVITRRLLPVEELRRIAARDPGGRVVADRLVDARLITVDDTNATLAHDTLLSWDRLSAWICERREALLWRHRIEADATEWDSGDRDPSLLYRGERLATAVGRADPALSTVATEFLRTSSQR